MTKDSEKGLTKLIISRIAAYAVLIFMTILCLFFFYLLFINSTRSNAELQSGFTMIPSGNFMKNFHNAWTDASINIPRGMLNSFVIAFISAILTCYFSALTAFGIRAYQFKGKKLLFTFIMAVMVIPT